MTDLNRDERSTKGHWERVYSQKNSEQMSWYAEHLDRSLDWITRAAKDRNARLVDAGGGASTLVDDLLLQNYSNVAVVDLSREALRAAKERLGEASRQIEWVVGDITEQHFRPSSVDVWHDRAVFHFLTDAPKVRAYVEELERVIAPGGSLIVATFGPNGPTSCSGLPVARRDAKAIGAIFSSGFELEESAADDHTTPWGDRQSFTYALLRRIER